MTAPIWPDGQRRQEFFARLEHLIQQYPELTNILQREHALDPCSSYWDCADGTSFDPNCPNVVQGIVLLISTANLDGWEDFVITDPAPQSQYMTNGMLWAAARQYLDSE